MIKKILEALWDLFPVIVIFSLTFLFSSMVVEKTVFPNCEFCGEQFDNKTSKLEQMCDICFGWNEHKAITDNGVQVTFSDGTGYYFERGDK